MALTRNSGIAVGFGIGLVIAGGIFGVTQLAKRASLTRTQVAVPPTNQPGDVTVPPAAETSPEATVSGPSDSLQDRLPSPEDGPPRESIEGIQESLKAMYGPP